MPKTVTDRERIAIYAMVAGYINGWKEAYILGAQKPEEEIRKQSGLNVYVTRWKDHKDIYRTYTEIKAFYEAQKQAIKDQARKDAGMDGMREEGRKDNESTPSDDGKKESKIVDYSNPDNQRRKLNQIVNNAKDSGEALDALKVIIQGQRADREAAREQKTVRAYLPLTCSECPLMEKARKKAGKG